MPDIPLPLSYRSELLEPLVEALKAGESCSLFGVGSSGKSNLVRHLMRPEVLEHYFGATASKTRYIYLDCNKLAECDPHKVYIAVLDAIERSAGGGGEEVTSLQSRVNQWWQEAVKAGNELITRRNLEHSFSALFRADIVRAILVLDDCDELIANASAALLRGLRALRDDYKGNLVFLLVTRRDLTSIRPATPDFESLHELVSTHRFAVRPYRESDATFMIRRLAARRELELRPLEDEEIQRLVGLTGGHAGLLRSVYFATRRGELALHPSSLTILINNDDVWGECQKIWDSLEEAEQTDLEALATGQPTTENGLRRLKFKGLVLERQEQLERSYTIFCPLFAASVLAMVRSSREPIGPVITLDPAASTVRVDDRVARLTAPEFQVLQLMYERRPQICLQSELIERLHEAEAGQPVSGRPDRRLERCVEQIKAKVEIPGRVLIVPMTGGGYRLIGEDGR